MTRLHFVLAPLLVFAIGMMTQQGPPPGDPKAPVLTEVQKLQLQNLTQRLEIAQLRMQAAQADFQAARTEIETLVKSLQVEGYNLDLQSLTYTKKPPPEKK